MNEALQETGWDLKRAMAIMDERSDPRENPSFAAAAREALDGSVLGRPRQDDPRGSRAMAPAAGELNRAKVTALESPRGGRPRRGEAHRPWGRAQPASVGVVTVHLTRPA